MTVIEHQKAGNSDSRPFLFAENLHGETRNVPYRTGEEIDIREGRSLHQRDAVTLEEFYLTHPTEIRQRKRALFRFFGGRRHGRGL